MRNKSKAKIYLGRIAKLNFEIENKMAEKTQYRDMALGITSHIGDERVQSSGSKQAMSNALDKVVDLEKEIDRKIDELIDVKREIIGTIEKLNAMEYDVLHKRYIQSMEFKEIGAIRRKSKSWATSTHGRALQSLNKILDEMGWDYTDL